MIRSLYCPKCGEAHKPHPGDVAAGWKHRHTSFAVKLPEDFHIVINGKKEAVNELMCDRCGDKMEPGSTGHAITMWRESVEDEPGDWESEYRQ